MSLLGDFFKGKKKSNMTPDIVPQMPGQINPQAYGDLSKLSHNYLNGVGTGFGDDFVSKATNPVIEASRRRFNQETVPAISSAASARGLGRSSIATDQLNKAGQEQQSQVDQLMSQFFQLNEAQKKSDTQFGAQLGQNILTGDTAAQHKQADTSMQINQNTANEQQQRYAANDAKAGQLGQGLVALGAAPFTGGTSLAMMPNFSQQSQIPQIGQIGQTTGAPQILGQFSGDELKRLKALLNGGQ